MNLHYNIIFSLKRPRFQQLAQQILQVFPGERELDWYYPSIGISKSQGWLYGAYRNARRKAKLIGIFQGTN